MGTFVSKLGCDALPLLSKLGCDALPFVTPPPAVTDAYCEPCEDPLEKQPAILGRQKSRIDDHSAPWAEYSEEPSGAFGAAGFNAAGVQRIDLPFGAHDVERVARFIDAEAAGAGFGPLLPFHRLGLEERLEAWKAEFAALDLGSYVDACAEGTHMTELRWSMLLIQPNKFFPAHQHPNVEVEFVLRGALYENRLIAQPTAPLPVAVLPDAGYPKLFRVYKHDGGSFFSNARCTVHQSYTRNEGVALLVLWTGRHVNLTDHDAQLWEAGRCANPECLLDGAAPAFPAPRHRKKIELEASEIAQASKRGPSLQPYERIQHVTAVKP